MVRIYLKEQNMAEDANMDMASSLYVGGRWYDALWLSNGLKNYQVWVTKALR